MRRALRASGHRTKKGPVFDTAIIAGVMAAKRTHELIPFCHPLGLDNCQLEIEHARAAEIVMRCQVSVHHRTGVEMEALTGAAVAALTIYDMCKALSHDIEITGVRLLAKSGGRRRFARRAVRRRRVSAALAAAQRAGAAALRPGARRRPQHAHAA